MKSFPRGHAYDPLPDFNCNDPEPSPIPRPTRWPFIVGAGCWLAALVLVAVLIARQLP